MKFSRAFNLTQSQAELDFVDIRLDTDTPLFIDPSVFSCASDAWSDICHQQIASFFQATVDAIRAGDRTRARGYLEFLSEPNETRLGLSSGRSRGRGIGGMQARQLYDTLAASTAVKTGFLQDLEECELLIPGIGADKISDIATNIIRGQLIQYTVAQCELHGIATRQVAAGHIWHPERRAWRPEYANLPVYKGEMMVLVPKAGVRWTVALSHAEYYRHFVLEFLRSEELTKGSGLVRTLQSGEKRVYKKDLKEKYPQSKEFLYEFSSEHPIVLQRYKELKRPSSPPTAGELDSHFDAEALSAALIEALRNIPPGPAHATVYHRLSKSILSFLFYPSLIYPKVEAEINEGRKRIDLLYTNGATKGFFERTPRLVRFEASNIPVECKNYSSDPSNPELDQLIGRFDRRRGWMGLLLCRSFTDRAKFVLRCRDSAQSEHGFVLPLADDDLIRMLEMAGRNARGAIDEELDRIWTEIVG